MEFPKSIKDFLKKPNFMILSELNSGGTIHSTIVWYEYDSDKNLFRFSTTSDRVKYKNLTKNSTCTFVIPNEDNMYQYVQVEGEVTSYTKKGGHDFIDKLTKHYMGKDKYPYDPERKEDRVTFTITPENFFAYGFED